MAPTVSVDPERVPAAFSVRAPYPNPARGAATLAFTLPAAEERVRVEVFDVAGRRVGLVHDGPMPAGEHAIAWSADGRGREAAAGVYFIRLRAGSRSVTQRLVMAR